MSGWLWMVNGGGGVIRKGIVRVLKCYSALYVENPSKTPNIPSQNTPVSNLRFVPFVSRMRTAQRHVSRFVATGLGFLAKVFKILQHRYVRMALRHILSPPCFRYSRIKTARLWKINTHLGWKRLIIFSYVQVLTSHRKSSVCRFCSFVFFRGTIPIYLFCFCPYLLINDIHIYIGP
jgi:hypothetical protein